VNKVWFIAKPDYSVFIADIDNIKFIVDIKGKTLYNFTKDMPGVSNCKGDCLNTWPVFNNENIVAPSMMNTSDFGVIINSEGSKQITYKQMPLYYNINDTKRGDINGDNVNNAWFIIDLNRIAAVPVNTTQSQVATSSVPAIKVSSFPSSAHGDTNITLRWEVSGGTPGNISNTAILWGYKNGSASISDYSKATVIQTGKTLQQFSTGIIIPASGTIYFRAHAIVDGTNVFSQEYQIPIIVQTSGY
jgi:predicted lipoprotein with Yx(FWY)xxD motif